MKQSGASGSMAMRQVRQQGQKPGDKPGQTPGANAGGAPATKPAKPSDRHSLAGGKDVWGHLPAELRQEMENVFKEDALPTKQDLIRRYYLSVAKQKTGPGRMSHDLEIALARFSAPRTRGSRADRGCLACARDGLILG